MEFGTPASAEQFQIKEYVGSLAIIAVNGFVSQFPTSFGLRDTVRCEIVIIDGDKAGARFSDGMIFGFKIVGQLKGQVGSVVLGRIGLGRAKPGQNPPYELAEATMADVALANEWVKANGDIVANVLPDDPLVSQLGGTGNPTQFNGQGNPQQEQWASQRQGQAYPNQQPPAQYANAPGGTFTGNQGEPPF